MNEKEWDVSGILTVTSQFLEKNGSDTPQLDAEVLLADTLGLQRDNLVVHRDRKLTDIELTGYREKVRQRSASRPVAQILKIKEFYSLKFHVNQNVLIPRPETEHLVEHALAWLSNNPATNQKSHRICDIGTGTGCIAAAIASSFPDIEILATEIDTKAASIAVKNITGLGLLSKIKVVKADLFPISHGPRFDLIVSNPPYISSKEYSELAPGVRNFEPAIALTDNSDGLSIYKRILREAPNRLHRGGGMILEISPFIEAGLKKLVDESAFKLVDIHPDLAGNPRVAVLKY